MTSNSSVFNQPSMQLFLIVALCLVSALIFSLIGGLAVILFYGFDMSSFYDYSNPNTIEGLKLFQLLSSIGLFIVPPIVYALITSKSILPALNLNQVSKPIYWVLVLFIMVVASPIMAWVVEVNAQMSLPSFMSSIEDWMKQSEASAEVLTKAFISFDGLASLFYILLIVAVVPAIGEELLFRGVIQKIFKNWTNNHHIAIWVTAIIFSALHMQFYGFLPRMLLGVFFGYLLVWSSSLWLPILGHFINNGSVVVLSYFYPELMENTELNIFNEDGKTWLPTIISFILVAVGIFLFKQLNTQKIETGN